MKIVETERIENLVEPQTFCDPSKKPEDPIDYIDISSIDRVRKKIIHTTRLLGSDAPSRARKKVFVGDVILSTVRPNLNAVALVDQNSGNLICSTGFCVLRPKKGILDPRYLLYQLRSPLFIGYSVKLATGANYPAISDRTVYEYRIPKISLDAQKEIVSVLSRAESALEKRREAIRLLDNFLKSTFLFLFGDPIQDPKKFQVVKVSDLCETMSGGTPDRSRPDYFGGDIPWIKSGELKNSFVTTCEEKITALGFENSSAKKLPIDSVLIAMYGATVGEVGLLKIPNATTNQAVATVIPKAEEKLEPIFLFHLFQHLTPYLLSRRVGGGQPNISQSIIRETKIQKPEYSLQKRFAKIAVGIDELKQKMESSETELQNLFNSLMQKAFQEAL